MLIAYIYLQIVMECRYACYYCHSRFKDLNDLLHHCRILHGNSQANLSILRSIDASETFRAIHFRKSLAEIPDDCYMYYDGDRLITKLSPIGNAAGFEDSESDCPNKYQKYSDTPLKSSKVTDIVETLSDDMEDFNRRHIICHIIRCTTWYRYRYIYV